MTCLDGGIPVSIRPPHDRMVFDRVRRALRRSWLGARAIALAPLHLRTLRRIRPPAAASIRRLLVVRTDRLGDMALTTVALQDLRQHFRKAEITVLAPAGPLALLESHPSVDRQVELTDAGLADELVGRFDLAIDFTPGDPLRGALLVARTRARLRAGFRGGGREVFFNIRAPHSNRRRHFIDRNRDLLEALGVPRFAHSPKLVVTTEEADRARSRLASLGAGSPRVAVHPGGHYPSQRWSPECYADVITLLTGGSAAACVVLSGPGEEADARRICASTPDALSTGPLTIREMMAVLAVCDLFVGNNSGPLHIAGALGVPTVSVMGPTDPERFSPRGIDDRIVRHALPCSPCDRGRCWHHSCLRGIQPEEVDRAATDALCRPAAREATR